MKIYLEISGPNPSRPVISVCDAFAIFSGDCPSCKADPLRVAGKNRRVVDDREYRADGYCLNCGSQVGIIAARPDTLFGISEDERVLEGRCRVY
jgi:hypothetical protein